MMHNPLLFITCALVVTGLAACAPNTLPPPENTGAPASPTAGGPLDGTPEPDSLNNEPDDIKALDHPVRRYDCGNGVSVKARYADKRHALVTYQGKTRSMSLTESADGTRYVGDDHEWWTRGVGHDAEATLFKHQNDGSTGDVIASCHAT